MYATIQKWGNSQGLRIPKALLDAVGLRENGPGGADSRRRQHPDQTSGRQSLIAHWRSA